MVYYGPILSWFHHYFQPPTDLFKNSAHLPAKRDQKSIHHKTNNLNKYSTQPGMDLEMRLDMNLLEDEGDSTTNSNEKMIRRKQCPPIVTQLRRFSYSCLKTEECCDTGCCVHEYQSMTQFWYAWFVFTILGAFVFGCCYYYKKQKLREMQAQQLAFRRQVSRMQQQFLHDQRMLQVQPPHHFDSNSSNCNVNSNNLESSYVNFLRQYNRPPDSPDILRAGPHHGTPINSLDDELPFGWTPQRNSENNEYSIYNSSNMFDIFYSNNPASDVRRCRGMCCAAASRLAANAPPPSYETLMGLASEENNDTSMEDVPPPGYLEACKLEGFECMDSMRVVPSAGSILAQSDIVHDMVNAIAGENEERVNCIVDISQNDNQQP